MKKLFLLCILASCAPKQPPTGFTKIDISPDLESPLFSSTEYLGNPLALKTEFGYDNVADPTRYVKKSTAIVNTDSLRLMRFTELTRMHPDTLQLILFETTPIISQELLIKIAGDDFKTTFYYVTPRPMDELKLKVLEQRLSLKAIPVKQGDTLLGRIYYKAFCEAGCEGEIEIQGDFKAELGWKSGLY
ncbi:MAG: hypothetical protein AAGA86_13530 [Bacteroidota bacterium]